MLPLKGNAVELNRKHGNMWRSRTYHPNKEFQTNKLLTSQNISIFITWRLSNPFHKIWSRGEILRPDTFTQSGMFRIFCGEQSFIKEFSGEEKKNFVDHLLFGGLPLKCLLSWNNFRLSLAEIWAWVTLISRGRGSWRDFAPVYSFSSFP